MFLPRGGGVFFSVYVLSDSQETNHLSHVMISHVMIMADMTFSHLTISMRSLKPSLEFDKTWPKKRGGLKHHFLAPSSKLLELVMPLRSCPPMYPAPSERFAC